MHIDGPEYFFEIFEIYLINHPNSAKPVENQPALMFINIF